MEDVSFPAIDDASIPPDRGIPDAEIPGIQDISDIPSIDEIEDLGELEDLVEPGAEQLFPMELPDEDGLIGVIESDNLGKYIREAGNAPLLNREQEFWASLDILTAKHATALDLNGSREQDNLIDIIHHDFMETWKQLRGISQKNESPDYDWEWLISQELLHRIKHDESRHDSFFVWINDLSQLKDVGRRVAELGVGLYADILCLPASDLLRVPARLAVGVNPFDKMGDLGQELGFEETIAERFTACQARAQTAKELLVVSNLRLVISVAKNYIGQGLGLEDLIQYGNLGLIRAIGKFDPCTGYRFSTYSHWWIRQAITRAVADHSRLIRVPVHAHDRMRKIMWIRSLLFQELQRIPTEKEIAEKMGDISEQNVRLALSMVHEPLSFDEPAGDERDTLLGDLIADKMDVQEDVIHNLLREEIDRQLKNLRPREQMVLALRYGLNDEEPCTLDEVGKMMGVTRERIRQIEANALAKLRNYNIKWKLIGYLDVE